MVRNRNNIIAAFLILYILVVLVQTSIISMSGAAPAAYASVSVYVAEAVPPKPPPPPIIPPIPPITPPVVELCTNGVLDAGETGVDCGGVCPPCLINKTCIINGDCQSGYCKFGICAIPEQPIVAVPAPVITLFAWALDLLLLVLLLLLLWLLLILITSLLAKRKRFGRKHLRYRRLRNVRKSKLLRMLARLVLRRIWS